MDIQVISLFPEMFRAVTDFGVTARALAKGLWQFDTVNPRAFAAGDLGYIDDKPFGGGPGMVMQVEPLMRAWEFARTRVKSPAPRLIYLTPQGQPWRQDLAAELARETSLVLVCGRYEGIDERFLTLSGAEEISVGDFVVSGGELPAMLLMDAVLRQVPGVLGHEQSAVNDSFAVGLLDYPQYTRPAVYSGAEVPKVLLSGNHEEIRCWRQKEALRSTLKRRPELLQGRLLNPEDTRLLAEIRREERD